MKRLIFLVGAKALDAAGYLAALVNLFLEAVASIFINWGKGKSIALDNIIMQILFTGVEAIPLLSIMGLMIGSIVIIQSTTLAPNFGAGQFLGKIMVIGVIRELGPLVTAFIVIGRSGAALSTYLGNMKITSELDALEVMGIDPVHVRVMPALIGFIVAITGLTLFFDAVAVLGGYLFSRLLVSLPLMVFMQIILEELSYVDIIISLFKCLLFGSVISIVSCYHAMNISTSFQEVPQATIRAVVHSIVFSVFLNMIVTVMFYANFVPV